jgi:molybdopterin biosynthesis enzyme MoaB
LGLELERFDGIFPIPSIEQPYLKVRGLRPIVVETPDVDAIHFRGGTRITKRMNAADATKPVLGNLAAGLE